VAYQMAPLWVTFCDLKGHFCCLKPLVSIWQGGSRSWWCTGGV